MVGEHAGDLAVAELVLDTPVPGFAAALREEPSDGSHGAAGEQVEVARVMLDSGRVHRAVTSSDPHRHEPP